MLRRIRLSKSPVWTYAVVDISKSLFPRLHEANQSELTGEENMGDTVDVGNLGLQRLRQFVNGLEEVDA